MSRNFNIQNGYWEGLVRGMKQALLTPEDYERIAEAESLEEVRSFLADTSYGEFMCDRPTPLTINMFAQSMRKKFSDEFTHLRSTAGELTVQFMDFIKLDFVIDNFVILLQGAINGKSGAELLERCSPLGWFPEMSIISGMNTSGGYRDLYLMVLTESSIGEWVERYLNSVIVKKQSSSGACETAGGRRLSTDQGFDMSKFGSLMEEIDVEELRHALKKYWLEAFYRFCTTKCDGLTNEIMTVLLKQIADLRTFGITLNTIPNMKTAENVEDVKRLRDAIIPGFGYCYPEGHLYLRDVNAVDQLRNAFAGNEMFDDILELVDPMDTKKSEKTFEDLAFEKINVMSEMAFTRQFHLGVLFALVRLQEQEVRNVIWILELSMIGRGKQSLSKLPSFST